MFRKPLGLQPTRPVLWAPLCMGTGRVRRPPSTDVRGSCRNTRGGGRASALRAPLPTAGISAVLTVVRSSEARGQNAGPHLRTSFRRETRSLRVVPISCFLTREATCARQVSTVYLVRGSQESLQGGRFIPTVGAGKPSSRELTLSRQVDSSPSRHYRSDAPRKQPGLLHGNGKETVKELLL